MIKVSHKKIIWILVVLAFFGITISALLAERIGLTANGDFGYIHVNHLEDGWKIYVDNQEKKISVDDPNVKVTSGLRDILVHTDGFWPWFKQIRVDKNQVTELSPFLAPQNPSLEVIPASDPEYQTLYDRAISKQNIGPTNLIKSNDGNVAIWTEDNDIFARWLSEENPPSYFCVEKCDLEIIFFKSQTPIKNLAFWKNRGDVVIISTAIGIYVFEIDNNGLQNFAPIYEGTDPTFYVAYDGSIYIADQGVLTTMETQ